MPRNSSGTYSATAGNPVVTETTITSTWANLLVADLGNELTNSLDRQGRGSMLAALKLFDGTVSLPGLSFNNEPGTGLFRPTTGTLNLGVQSTSVMSLTTALVNILTGLQVSGAADFDGVLTGTSAVFSGTVAGADAVDPDEFTTKDQLDDAFLQALAIPYTTSALTAGAVFSTAAGVTIPTGIAQGQVFGVYNNSGATITLTQGSGLTLRYVGSALTGNRTLAQRGLAFFLPISTTEYIVSGGGVL